MPFLSRHRWIIAGLLIYWAALFIATHLPIHDLGHRTGMSDKTMHVLAYLGLVLFAWLAVSPQSKVNWRKPKVWILLIVVVWYGVLDEVLQSFVGRSAEVGDFVANMVGVLTGLGILTFLNMWPAILLVSAIFIFVLSNMARIDQITGMPFINIAFHFTAYGTFTLIWIHALFARLTWDIMPVKWFAAAVSAPTALLLSVKATASLFGRPIWPIDLLTAISGIVLAVLVSRFVCKTIWLPVE